jgi:protease PrsW
MSFTITDTMVGFALIALGPAMLILWFYLHQTRMDANHKKLMFRTFWYGTLAIIPVYVLNQFMIMFFDFDIQYFLHTYSVARSVGYIFLGCLIVATIEEYAKSIIVKEVDWNRKEFTRVVDGIEFSIACGLGFAFAENVIYFYQMYNMVLSISNELMWAIIFRSTLSMLAHSVFSGIFGYYYGKAKVLNLKYKKLNQKHRSFGFHFFHGLSIRIKRMQHLLKSKNLHLEVEEKLKEKELIAEGMVAAILLHTAYNFFLTYDYAWISVIIIGIELFIILHEFETHKNTISYSRT